MFGSRLALCAIAALTLGAGSALAQSQDPEAVNYCIRTVELVGYQEVYNWEYDDPSKYDVTYSYDPSKCAAPNATFPVNYIRLYDNVGGGIYTCSLEQFAANRTTIHSECILTRYVLNRYTRVFIVG
jgi:hypothetical protein